MINAIYARQSVERSDSISIESQIEFCSYELRGQPYQVYADRGFSGKDTDRPAFIRMMADIECGRIGKVVVYKLDRISRSVLDFSSMMERFGKHKVEFISTMEKFDTSSPMGRAMLSICIVFAQLERETIQRRVADAYFSRSQKSLYMGGRVPYGFRLIPTVVGGVRTSRYETVREEAEQIKLIYALYSDPESSYADVVRCLSERTLTKRGHPWGRTHLAPLLKNPVYVRADLSVYRFFRDRGVEMVNPPEDFIGTNGCYYYKNKESDADSGYLVLAPHEGIVPAELWLKCRSKCQEKTLLRPCQKAKNTWLAGKIKCALCGYALIDKHYASSGRRYLLCSNRMNAKTCPGPGTIYSEEIELLVSDEIERKLASFGTLSDPKAKIPDSHLLALNVELAKVENEILSLTRRISNADDTIFRYLKEQLHILDQKKSSLLNRISALGRDPESPVLSLDPTLLPWDHLTFDDKRRVVDLLIRVIHVSSHQVAIEWRF